MALPEEFIERLQKITGELFPEIEQTFSKDRSLSVRVNTLKAKRNEIIDIFRQCDCSCEAHEILLEALSLSTDVRSTEVFAELIREGRIYAQGVSSMLPVFVLDPQPGEMILDACAAPGSKTSQMAARMKNEGHIRALEVVRKRMFRLQSVLRIMGVTNTKVTCCDARRFRPREERYDRILVDAPCSSEARFSIHDPESYAYWSPRKIKEMVRKQRGILLSASRLLQPGGRLLYSTCSFAPEENEGVIDWFLRKTEGRFSLLPITTMHIPTYPIVHVWGKRAYDDRVCHCVRVKPTGQYEGFFMALLTEN